MTDIRELPDGIYEYEEYRGEEWNKYEVKGGVLTELGSRGSGRMEAEWKDYPGKFFPVGETSATLLRKRFEKSVRAGAGHALVDYDLQELVDDLVQIALEELN